MKPKALRKQYKTLKLELKKKSKEERVNEKMYRKWCRETNYIGER